MKVVINKCYGGFSLSQAAVKRYAELQGRECYFFDHDYKTDLYKPVESGSSFFHAFDISNPNELLRKDKEWNAMTLEERQEQNSLYQKHSIENRPEGRDDPLLVQVVEELGDAANGSCAELSIVEVPDDVEWTIDEYDGMEHIAEVHRTWH